VVQYSKIIYLSGGFMNDYRDSVRHSTKEIQWTFRYLWWRILLLMMIFSAIGFGITLLSRPAQIIEKVTEPDRIIQNYEWFENTYNDALAIDRQIKTAKQTVIDFESSAGSRSEWGRTETNEHSRLNSVLQGLRYQRDNIISDYNARSNQVTRKLFKGSNLPYQLETTEDRITEVWER
jgi:hypothetical protein